jgi:peptidoglycan/LPS O-acetylase OafA/YrhL
VAPLAGPARLEYQPALDGLRAVAVLAVMLFHHDGDWLPGGFLGVDVFFVLSGYLITSLLLLEHRNTGKVVSVRFWMRRAQRLVPALVLMLGLLALFYATAAPVADAERARDGALATLFFAKNYWDAFVNVGWRAPTHTWSLAVEEQFYLVWPVMLGWLLARTASRSGRLLGSLGAMILVSAGLRLAWSFHNATYANEALETRASSLLVGAALAVFSVSPGATLLARRHRALDRVAIAGALACLGSFVWVGIDRYDILWYGGGLLIAAATAAVIFGVVHGQGGVRRVLSHRVLRAIGLISYGLYLYHLIVFMWITEDRFSIGGPTVFALRFACSFALAAASFVWVERPIRRIALRRVGRLMLLGATPLLTVLIVFGAAEVVARDVPAGVSVAMRANWIRTAEETPDGATRVLVAGDSFAAALASTEPRALQARVQGTTAAVPTCGAGRGAIVLGAGRYPVEHCDHVDTVFPRAVVDVDPDVAVLLIGAGDVFDREVGGRLLRFDTPELEAYLGRRLDAIGAVLTDAGARLAIAIPPCMPAAPGAVVDAFGGVRAERARHDWLAAVLRRAAERAGASVIDLNRALCDRRGVRRDAGATPTGFTDRESYLVWTAIADAVAPA